MASQILKYIGKGSVWEELSRSAETSTEIQKKKKKINSQQEAHLPESNHTV